MDIHAPAGISFTGALDYARSAIASWTNLVLIPGDNFESIHFFICFETAISEL